MAVPVKMHEKFAPRPVFVPFLRCSSSSFLSDPVFTSKRQPPLACGSITGSTQALLLALADSMNEEASGTIAPLAAGSGERTVRAHSHAMIVARDPSGSSIFG